MMYQIYECWKSPYRERLDQITILSSDAHLDEASELHSNLLHYKGNYEKEIKTLPKYSVKKYINIQLMNLS